MGGLATLRTLVYEIFFDHIYGFKCNKNIFYKKKKKKREGGIVSGVSRKYGISVSSRKQLEYWSLLPSAAYFYSTLLL